MSDIKYLSVQGLEELIILTQNALAKKADVLQFDVMPDPTKYIGKIVQYVGVSDISFTRSHFYYSNGVKWTEENASGGQTPKIEMVTSLPSWADSDPQVLYILKNTADMTMSFYVKNTSVNDAWFTVEKSVSFTVVSSLPQWADADSGIIYFKANGNDLVGYIKNIYTIDAWYTFGEKPQIIIDTAISATSENPVQNKVIFTEVNTLRAQANMILTASQDADKKLHDAIEANSNALGMLGTEVGGIHDDIEANSNALGMLGTEVSGIHDDIAANSSAIGALGTEVSGIHDDIAANQTEINTIKQNLLGTYATQRYVQDQNLLSDSEFISISDNESAPTRMEYDGYVTVSANLASAPTKIFINGLCVACAPEGYSKDSSVAPGSASGDTGVTAFVAKGDTVYATPRNSYTRSVKARFYKLRDYTGR